MSTIVPFDDFVQHRFERSFRLNYLSAPDQSAYFLASVPRYGTSNTFRDPAAAKCWAFDEFLRGWSDEWRREDREAAEGECSSYRKTQDMKANHGER